MTAPVQEQIRKYSTYVDERVAPIELGEMSPRPVTVLPVRGLVTKRRYIVAFSVAVAVTLALALPFLLLGGEEPKVATTPPPSTVPTSVTTSTAPVATTTAAPSPAAPTIYELPSVETAGWSWVPSEVIPHGIAEDGSWFHFDVGYNCPVRQPVFYVREDLNAECPTSPADAEARGIVATDDPVEAILTSADGQNWERTEVTRFEGLFTHLRPSYLSPTIQLQALDVAQAGSTAASSRFVSNDGTTWSVLNPTVPDGLTDRLKESLVDPARIGDTIVSLTQCSNSGYLLVSDDVGASFSIVDGLPRTTSDVDVQAVRAIGGIGLWPDCEPHRAVTHNIFTLNGIFYGIQYSDTTTEPNLWMSEDGYSWSTVGRTEGLVLSNGAVVRSDFGPATIEVDNAVIAVAHPDPAISDSGGRTHFLTSSDGLRWRELNVPGCVAPPGNGSTMHPASRVGGAATWILFSYCSAENMRTVFGRWNGDGFDWFSANGERFQDTIYQANGLAIWRRDPNGDVYLAVPPG